MEYPPSTAKCKFWSTTEKFTCSCEYKTSDLLCKSIIMVFGDAKESLKPCNEFKDCRFSSEGNALPKCLT